MSLTRDDVVDAAVDLLAEAGLEGLTLRGLARRLGVSAPTLYWHVADKRTLLDHVAERLLADQWTVLAPRPGQDWAEWLRERAMTQFRALVSHRDAALVVAGNRPTAAALPAVEQVLATLVEAGLSPLDAFATLQALGNLVIGSAVEYHAERDRVRAAPHAAPAPPDPAVHPHLAALLPALAGHGPGDHEALFGHGLDLMIAGVQARLAGTAGPVPGSGSG